MSEGRNKSVVEEVYRMMGQPVPENLQKEIDGKTNLVLEEVVDEADYDPEEEEELPEIEFMDVPSGAYEAEIREIVKNMYQSEYRDLIEDPSETPAAKNTNLNMKAFVFDTIRRVDDFITLCLYQLAHTIVSKKQGVHTGRDIVLWDAIVGYHVSERGEVGLVMKADSFFGKGSPKLSDVCVLIMDDNLVIDSELRRLPLADKMYTLLGKMSRVMQPATKVVTEDLITLDYEVTDDVWSKKDPPKQLKIIQKATGDWKLDRSHMGDIDGYGGDEYPSDEFRLNKRTFWVQKEWAEKPVVKFVADEDGFSVEMA